MKIKDILNLSIHGITDANCYVSENAGPLYFFKIAITYMNI